MARPKKRKPAVGRPAAAPTGGKDLLGQLRRLQEEILRAQEALAQERVEVSVGGGAVKVVMGGDHKVHAIEIADELLDPDEKDMLQDLLVAAMNQATEQLQRLTVERLQAVSGGLPIPGLGL